MSGEGSEHGHLESLDSLEQSLQSATNVLEEDRFPRLQQYLDHVSSDDIVPVKRVLRLLYENNTRLAISYEGKIRTQFKEGKLPETIASRLKLNLEKAENQLEIHKDDAHGFLEYLIHDRFSDDRLHIIRRNLADDYEISVPRYTLNKTQAQWVRYYAKRESDVGEEKISLKKLVQLLYKADQIPLASDRKVRSIDHKIKQGNLQDLGSLLEMINHEPTDRIALHIDDAGSVLEHIINGHSYRKQVLWDNMIENLREYREKKDARPLLEYCWCRARLHDYIRNIRNVDDPFVSCSKVLKLLYPEGSQGHTSKTAILKKKYLSDGMRLGDSLRIGDNGVLEVAASDVVGLLEYVLATSREDRSPYLIRNLASFDYLKKEDFTLDDWYRSKIKAYAKEAGVEGYG